MMLLAAAVALSNPVSTPAYDGSAAAEVRALVNEMRVAMQRDDNGALMRLLDPNMDMFDRRTPDNGANNTNAAAITWRDWVVRHYQGGWSSDMPGSIRALEFEAPTRVVAHICNWRSYQGGESSNGILRLRFVLVAQTWKVSEATYLNGACP